MIRLPLSSYLWPSALRSFRKGSPAPQFQTVSVVCVARVVRLGRLCAAQVWGHVMLLATLGNIGSFTVTGPQRPCFELLPACPGTDLTMHDTSEMSFSAEAPSQDLQGCKALEMAWDMKAWGGLGDVGGGGGGNETRFPLRAEGMGVGWGSFQPQSQFKGRPGIWQVQPRSSAN